MVCGTGKNLRKIFFLTQGGTPDGKKIEFFYFWFFNIHLGFQTRRTRNYCLSSKIFILSRNSAKNLKISDFCFNQKFWHSCQASCIKFYILKDASLDSKLNSVQDGINRLSLACTQVAVTPVQKVI